VLLPTEMLTDELVLAAVAEIIRKEAGLK